MQHDVFISYSTKDKQIADALVHYLEEHRVRCWIAPRDIVGGMEYADVIVEAIETTKVVLVLFSDAAQHSQWVRSEINRAMTLGKIIIPVKIADVIPERGMGLYLGDRHWIDIYPDLESNFCRVLPAVRNALGGAETKGTAPSRPCSESDHSGEPKQSPIGDQKSEDVGSKHQEGDELLSLSTVGHQVRIGVLWPKVLVATVFAGLLLMANIWFHSSFEHRRASANETFWGRVFAEKSISISRDELVSGRRFFVAAMIWIIFSGWGYLLFRNRTERALQRFNQRDWAGGQNDLRFSFRMDGWILFWRASCHFFGLGDARRDVGVAKGLFKESAQRGVAEACYALAILEERQGSPSFAGTKKLYQSARRQGSILALWRHGEVQGGDRIEHVDDDTMKAALLAIDPQAELCWIRKENRFWLIVFVLIGVSCLMESMAVGFLLGPFIYGIPVCGVLWHIVRQKRTRKALNSYANGSYDLVHARDLWCFKEDRYLLLYKATCHLFGTMNDCQDGDKACDLLEMSVARGCAEAWVVLVWLADTGRTNRYSDIQVSWMRKEAQKRAPAFLKTALSGREVGDERARG